MSTIALPRFLQSFLTRWHFKVTLPAKRRARLHDIELDISGLSPLMKNHILEGRYEFQERRLVQRCLTKKDVVLELGGAIGFIGLFCRKVIGVKHHITVEPNPNTITMLRRNYELNKLTPDVIEAAASAEDGQISLDIGGEFWENSIVTSGDSSKQITVPSLSFPSIVQRMPEPPTALICDIEGAETHLNLAQIPPSVTRIIIELHPGIVGEEATKRVINQIHFLGFHTRAVEENTWLFMR